jgi:C4-dicarboxylate transporter DctM subunit
MSPEINGIIGIGIMLLLMFINVPVGICMALIGFIGYSWIAGLHAGLSLGGLSVVSTVDDFNFAVLPLFLLMGEFGEISGMTKDGYRAANIWLGHLPGGLAMSSIVGSAAFSALSGSSMACAAIMSRIALPSLLEHKYKPHLAVGSLAAGATLGNLIPPGVLYIFYAIMAQASVGQLFIGSVIPGIVLALMYVIQIWIQCKIDPSAGPRGAKTTWKQKVLALRDAAALIFVFFLVMGGIEFGIFTPFEAAATGTLFVFIYSVLRKTVSGQNLAEAFQSTTVTVGMIFAVIVGAKIFTSYMAITNLSQSLATWVVNTHFSKVGVVIIIMGSYFILGTAMDTLSMMLLTVPIFLGIINALNIDLIWFGVLVVIQMELASLSPPTGMNIFIVYTMGRDKGITMSTVFRGVTPFCFTMLVLNAFVIAVPQTVTWLVSVMK